MTYRDLMNLKMLADAISQQRRDRSGPWGDDPCVVVAPVPPTAAFIANRAIAHMMMEK